jgi:flagellar hook-length control protein FliK
VINDVSSKNDFFLKSSPKKTSTEAVTADEVQSPSRETKKKASEKSDFASQLKSTNKVKSREPLVASRKVEVKDRFSNEPVQEQKTEAPIQKRSPQSQRAILNEGPVQKVETNEDEDTFSPLEKYTNPKSSKNDNVQEKLRSLLQQVDEESFDNSEGPINEVKSDPNLQLLAFVASPQFDVKNLSPKELKEVKDALREQQADVKQASVQKFMSQLQNQFGITPEKVVQAFAKMDEKSLTAPPSETINQFVNNLQVPSGQRSKIADLYRQMINETGEAAMNEKLLGADDRSNVSMKITDTTQLKLEELNKSLDQLNDSFFRNGAIQGQNNNQQLPQNIKEQLRQLVKANPEEQNDDKAASPIAALIAQATGKTGGAASSQAAMGAQATSESVTSATPAPAMTTANLLSQMTSSSVPNKNSDQSEFGQNKDDQSRGAKNYSSQNTSNIAGGNSKNFADIVKINGKGDSLVQAKGASVDASAMSSAGVVGANVTTSATAGTTAAALTPQQMMTAGPSKQEASEGAQEIIKQAQIMIKKGGGEMNVEMKPEGMGQVHLKVALDNGQVNIQMMAQNDKVKRLLEDGIHELKSNLVAHKLQVESLKVGIADGALQDKKMEHQQSEGQREAMRDAQKEFASNFMGQQRQDRENMRQGFTDIPGWRAYRNDQKRVSVEATDNEMQTRSRDDGRRLSLIA